MLVSSPQNFTDCQLGDLKMSKKTPPQQLRGPEGEHRSLNGQLHEPVLLDEVLQYLSPKSGETYLDLTAGYGGHASAVLRAVGDANVLTLVDRDINAIRELESFKQAGARIIHGDFASSAKALAAAGEQFDMILVDLGVSSPQLDRGERGFSFRVSGPLDMRMDARQPVTAGDIVNHYPEAELARIIREYGEEPAGFARRIARAIVEARPVLTTGSLAEVVLRAHRGPRKKVHPATRTFQALRIAVNDELGQVSEMLSHVPRLLKPDGRVAVISFHSLEDRLVKRFFVEQSSAGYESQLAVLTKKAAVASEDEVVHNPRARSAKLRAAVKINTNKERT